MTVTERPVYGRLELERWDQPLTRHPAAVIYSASGADASAWTYVTGPTTAPTTNTTSTTIEGNTVVFHSANWGSTQGQYSFKAQKTLTGLSIGRSYTYTVKLAVDTHLEARIGLGTVTSDWVQGTGNTSQLQFMKHTVTFIATATSHVFWREARYNRGSSNVTQSNAVWIYADDTTITRKAWTEILPGAKWVPYIADATGCSIRRGGSRSGLGIKTDVGTMSFTLHNAQDPLNGGAFKSGQTVRAVLKPKADGIYSHGFGGTQFQSSNYSDWVERRRNLVTNPAFRTDTTGWSAAAGGGAAATSVRSAGAQPSELGGTGFLRLTYTTAGTWWRARHTARLPVTAGDTYTASGWAKGTAASDVKVILTWYNAGGTQVSQTASTNFAVTGGAWSRYEYTAQAPTGAVTVLLEIGRGAGVVNDVLDLCGVLFEKATALGAYFDGATTSEELEQTRWTGTADASVSVLETRTSIVPVFTGTVSDVKAAYPLDKATGKKRVSVTVEVADAVKIHGTTPRYGAMIGAPFYETFEQRITRLAGSALAPIEPPAIGAPREVYSF